MTLEQGLDSNAFFPRSLDGDLIKQRFDKTPISINQDLFIIFHDVLF